MIPQHLFVVLLTTGLLLGCTSDRTSSLSKAEAEQLAQAALDHHRTDPSRYSCGKLFETTRNLMEAERLAGLTDFNELGCTGFRRGKGDRWRVVGEIKGSGGVFPFEAVLRDTRRSVRPDGAAPESPNDWHVESYRFDDRDISLGD